MVLVQACTTVPATVEPPGARADRYESRAARLSALPAWTLRARLAVSDGEDGGSGSLRWAESGDGSRMDFHGALGRGAWRLDAGQSGAELEVIGKAGRAGDSFEMVRERTQDDLAPSPVGAEDLRYDKEIFHGKKAAL